MEHTSIALYYISFDKPFSEEKFNHYLKLLPSADRLQAFKFLRWEDAHCFLFGRLALLKAFNLHGFVIDLCEIKKTVYGKPYLDNKLSFNLSHSQKTVVCGISSSPIRLGVDVEGMKPININDFKHLFTTKELYRIVNSIAPNRAFYTYWCIKEAAVKADGRGLAIDFKDVVIEEETVMVGHRDHYFYQTFCLCENYMVAVVTDQPNSNCSITDISDEFNF